MPACPFITVPFGLCKQILIDLYRYFGSLTGSGSFHHRADGLGNPALFADDSAHIVRGPRADGTQPYPLHRGHQRLQKLRPCLPQGLLRLSLTVLP